MTEVTAIGFQNKSTDKVCYPLTYLGQLLRRNKQWNKIERFINIFHKHNW